MIADAEKKMQEFFISPRFSIRDDEIEKEISLLLNGPYTNLCMEGCTKIVLCPHCKSIYGSDVSILECKNCGSKTKIVNQDTLYIDVQCDDILKKMEQIEFYPDGCKKRLKEFISQLPQQYKLILEKERDYTISYKGRKLDPRFVTILMIPIINRYISGPYDMITAIQGDVVKKFDYYSLCYLNEEDCLNKIFMHGLITDSEKKKLRWNDDEGEIETFLNGVNRKEFRAFLLKHNITSNVVLNNDTLKKDVKSQVNLYIKMKRLLEKRNTNNNKKCIRQILKEFYESFLENAINMKLNLAYNFMVQYVNHCWKITKDEKLSINEQEVIVFF